ncbi:Gfo/Idh/MocA family protein [Nibricoccus sp. IMCC34717]|uniref:Gfo/Idh/MocA family protein n=1 Tax=Nibricoccus sp. IMCC34717 TaxID=3034021 RepID=UPI0038515B06
MINLGIIGGGMVAENHMKALAKLPGHTLRWIAEVNETRLAYLRDTYKPVHTTTRYAEVLADPTVDAVIICTPPSMHEAMFLETLAAGKHVLLEKPAAIKRDSLKNMVEAARKHPNLIISDCSARHARLQPKFPFVKKLIDEGRLGDVYYIHHAACNRQGRGGIEYHPTAKWFLNKAIAGGGPLLDWGVYDLSFHLGLLGDKHVLESVEATTMRGLDRVDPGTPIFDVEEHGFALMRFSGGLRYYWERANQNNVEVPNQTRIHGTLGGVKLSYCTWESAEIEFFDIADEGRGKARKETLKVDMSQHLGDMEELDKAFLAAVSGQGPVPMSLELAARNLETIFRVYDKAGA